MKKTTQIEVLDPEIVESISDKEIILQVEGKVISSNLDSFEQEAEKMLAAINTELVTDEDFDIAKDNASLCSTIEKRIDEAKEKVFKAMPDIYEQLSRADKVKSKFGSIRITLTNASTSRKKIRIAGVIKSAVDKLTLAVNKSPAKHGFSIDISSINAAPKGKHLISKVEEAVSKIVESEELRLANLEADFLANMEAISASEVEFAGLYPDKLNLALSSREVVSSQIMARVADFRFKDAEKKRKEAEDSDRIKREEAAKSEAEAKRKEQEDADAKDRAQKEEPTFDAPPPPPSGSAKIGQYTPPVNEADTVKIYTLTIRAYSRAIGGIIDDLRINPYVVSTEVQRVAQ